MSNDEGLGLETGADELVVYLSEEEKCSVSEVSEELDLDERTVKTWAEALKSRDLLDIEYSPIKGMILEYLPDDSYSDIASVEDDLEIKADEVEISVGEVQVDEDDEKSKMEDDKEKEGREKEEEVVQINKSESKEDLEGETANKKSLNELDDDKKKLEDSQETEKVKNVEKTRLEAPKARIKEKKSNKNSDSRGKKLSDNSKTEKNQNKEDNENSGSEINEEKNSSEIESTEISDSGDEEVVLKEASHKDSNEETGSKVGENNDEVVLGHLDSSGKDTVSKENKSISDVKYSNNGDNENLLEFKKILDSLRRLKNEYERDSRDGEEMIDEIEFEIEKLKDYVKNNDLNSVQEEELKTCINELEGVMNEQPLNRGMLEKFKSAFNSKSSDGDITENNVEEELGVEKILRSIRSTCEDYSSGNISEEEFYSNLEYNIPDLKQQLKSNEIEEEKEREISNVLNRVNELTDEGSRKGLFSSVTKIFPSGE